MADVTHERQTAWPDTEIDRQAFAQAKQELGSSASVSALLQRAQEIKQEKEQHHAAR